MERELRRYQDMLFCVGTGVITFGFWSLVKGVMSIIFYKDELDEIIKQIGTTVGTPEEELGLAIPAVYIVMLIIICLDVLLRLIVGSSARREGKGRANEKQWKYLGFGVILAIICIASLIGDITNFKENFLNPLDGIITIVIEATSVVMVTELFVAGIKVKILKKKVEEAKLEEAAA